VLGQALDHRDDTAQFLLRGNRIRAGAGRFAADVDDLRAFVGQAQCVIDRRIGVGKPAAVGEGVGSGVDDPHHHHRPREFKRKVAGDPAHTGDYLRLAKRAIGKAYFKPSLCLRMDCSAVSDCGGPNIT